MLKSESALPVELSVEVMQHRVQMIRFDYRVQRVGARVDAVSEQLRNLLHDLKRLQSSDAPKGWFM